jgi:transcriptional regulator with XRE-family HTH domain
LREQRERRGITSQAELARRLGWDKTLINNYETRGTTVPDARAEQLADFFGMDIVEVRRGLGLWVPPADREGPTETDEDALIERIRRDPAKRRRLLDAILAAHEPDPEQSEEPAEGEGRGRAAG